MSVLSRRTQDATVTLAVIDQDGGADASLIADLSRSAEGAPILMLSPQLKKNAGWASDLGIAPLWAGSLGQSCDLAIQKAQSPYVAFLHSAARPTSNWMVPAVDMLRRAEGLSAVRFHQTGATPKSVTVLGLPGRAAADPADDETLAVAVEGSMVNVRHVRAVGGFAPLRDWGGVGVNLGWRLWLAGGSVRWCLDAEIESPVPPISPADELGAAIASVATCWGDRRRHVALTALEAAGFDGVATEATRWDPERDRAQRNRRRSDTELLRLFESPDAQGGLAVDFGPSRRILVVTDDVLSQAMAGPAIRAWHMADELAGDGHEVRLVTTTDICERRSDRFGVEAPNGGRWTELEDWAEVVVHQGYALTKVPALRDSSKIMVADVYDPIQLEVLELSKNTPEPERTDAIDIAVRVLNDQLKRADFVLCASEKQRDLWLGTLASLGRVSGPNYDSDPTLHRLIDVVPFGLPAEPPVKGESAIRGAVAGIGPGDRVIIWGGGIYNWFDPLTLIEAVDRLKGRIPTVRLFFMGGRHPNPLTPEMRMSYDAQRLSDSLHLTGVHIFFNEGWVDYEQRHNYLLDADVGVSLHLDHIETAFSFRTRILDYIWAGLPIVATAGDAFAEMIERDSLGIVVPPADVEATAEALWSILDDGELAEKLSRSAAEARSAFAWPRAMQPLVDFCRAPRQAPDRIRPPGTPARRDGLPPGLERIERYSRAAARRYRRGGLASVAEGAVNTFRRVSSRGGP